MVCGPRIPNSILVKRKETGASDTLGRSWAGQRDLSGAGKGNRGEDGVGGLSLRGEVPLEQMSLLPTPSRGHAGLGLQIPSAGAGPYGETSAERWRWYTELRRHV